MSRKKELVQEGGVTESQVREYLEAHPEFLSNIAPVKRDLGDGVEDFQYHLLKNLQNSSKTLSQRYDLLVDYCRDNLSAQSQVHNAVLKLMRTRGVEQLLEFLSIDMLSLFDLDVVRIAMESDVPFDTSYGDSNYSGIVFVPSGTSDILFSGSRNVLLFADSNQNIPIGFEYIFVDCEDMARSCALLRLELEVMEKNIILALGVRHAERFHAGQGVELLHFLAQVVSLQLDKYLDDLTL